MRVAAVAAGLALAGCAATPEAVMSKPPPAISLPEVLLEGPEWVVEDVAGGGVIDNARLTASFERGRISGRGGCNRYMGGYTYSGGALKIGPLGGTRMACAPALMDLEGKFLAVLGTATSVRTDETGALILTAPDGRSLKLRR